MPSSLLSFTVVALSFLIISCGKQSAIPASTKLVSGEVNAYQNQSAMTPAAARSAIVTCTKTGDDVAGLNTIYFRGADCSDGNLPDASYLAVLSNLRADGGTSGEYTLGQTLTGDPAFVKFFASTAGGYAIQVSYLKSSLANVVSCVRRGTVTQNNMRIDYQPGDCSGGRLPDNRYLGSLSTFLVGNGSHGGWRVSQPLRGQSATVNFWANTVGAAYAVRVMYVVDLPGPVVVCSRTGTTVAGLNSPPYLAAGCDAGRLPKATSFAFQTAVQVQNGYNGNIRFHQPYSDGAAQTNFQAAVGGSGYSIQTVYGEF